MSRIPFTCTVAVSVVCSYSIVLWTILCVSFIDPVIFIPFTAVVPEEDRVCTILLLVDGGMKGGFEEGI